MHWVSSREEQGWIAPVHEVALVLQEQPIAALQLDMLVSALHGVGVPLQVVHVQPYSFEHAVCVVFATQGVTVPEQ